MELHDYAPNAIWILNVRYLPDWIDSVRHHGGGGQQQLQQNDADVLTQELYNEIFFRHQQQHQQYNTTTTTFEFFMHRLQTHLRQQQGEERQLRPLSQLRSMISGIWKVSYSNLPQRHHRKHQYIQLVLDFHSVEHW